MLGFVVEGVFFLSLWNSKKKNKPNPKNPNTLHASNKYLTPRMTFIITILHTHTPPKIYRRLQILLKQKSEKIWQILLGR